MEAFCLDLVIYGSLSIKTKRSSAVAVAQAQALALKISFRVLFDFEVHRIQETHVRFAVLKYLSYRWKIMV
jgi:hypothetical protein